MKYWKKVAVSWFLAGAAVWFPAKTSGQKAPPQSPGPGRLEMLPDAPDFELKSLEGKVVHLSDYRGKAVVLNFWATWCVPCKKEMPWLIAFQKQYGPQGLVIVGISMDSSTEPVRPFAKKLGVNYPILFGNQSVADQYWVKGLPVSIFIDKAGRMTDQVPGMPTRSLMENEIKLALKNAPDPPGK
jgi:peroxiredoxin